MHVVMDTNVPVVANGKSAQASLECARACIRRIERLNAGEDILVLDDGWRIIREYRQQLDERGQRRPGDQFLRWVLQNRTNPARCSCVTISPRPPDTEDYAEFPDDPALVTFDRNDRKFVAVALAHPDHPPVLNAVDTDWWEHQEALARHGVQVEFLCPYEMERRADRS